MTDQRAILTYIPITGSSSDVYPYNGIKIQTN
jgi:hypothetical protein